MKKNKLHITLPIENDSAMLKEYGRAAILTTNVEFFLKEAIKRKGGKITEDKTLGQLIGGAKNHLPIRLVRLLDNFNKKRIKLIHGTVGSTQSFKTKKEWHFIQKNGEEFPIGTKFIKKYSDQARNIIIKLITLKLCNLKIPSKKDMIG